MIGTKGMGRLARKETAHCCAWRSQLHSFAASPLPCELHVPFSPVTCPLRQMSKWICTLLSREPPGSAPWISFSMKATFLSGASPINNKSSTFLYRLLLKAWFGTRPCRCKQITVGKEARRVSCLRGLWNPRFDNRAGVDEPARQTELAGVTHLLSHRASRLPSLNSFQFPSLALSGHKLHFSESFEGEGGCLNQFHK